MLNKTKIALAAAIVFGVASAALANDRDYDSGGGFQVQTWKEIQKANQAVGGTSYGFESPSHKQVASRKKPQPR
jgi:hypothetical protein